MEQGVSGSAVYTALPEPSIGEDSHEVEQKLADEIRGLWLVHLETQTAAKKTKAELASIRQWLGKSLWCMKRLLAKQGRSGRWSEFLRSEGIAKATGDRLVRAHAQSINPEPNIISEEFSEPTEAQAERVFAAVWPRLKRELLTPHAAYLFLMRFVGYFELGDEMSPNGILVLEPSDDEVRTSTAATPEGEPTDDPAADHPKEVR
jgi:hypothetical protein